MKSKFAIVSAVITSGALLAGTAQASDMVFGAIVGAGAGALIGNSVGGRDGAIIGGALGAATGATLANDHRYNYGGYQARPVYQAAPGYYVNSPQPSYYAAPVYYTRPVMVAPQPVYYVSGYRGWEPRHRRHHRHDRHDRHDRDWDDRGRGHGDGWRNRHRD